MHRNDFQKLVFLTLFGLLLVAVGCSSSTDPCETLACVHGACTEGNCICDSIYEGRHCDSLSSTKFLGETWTNDVLCQGPGYSLSSQVRAGAQAGSLVVHNVLQLGDRLDAVAHGDTISVAMQVYGTGTIHGEGLYSPTAFTLELELTDPFGLSSNCVAVFRR